MLKHLFILFSILQIISCKPKTREDAGPATTAESATEDGGASESFFPVTNYIRGQIHDIGIKGINPMKYTTKNKHLDSTWLKTEDLEKEMAPFLETVIDTANLQGLFSEKKFLDQTLNAYTFSYDPKRTLPDSLKLQRWDLYVDPSSNKIKRIYLIRKTADNKQQQLTWQSDKWCKIVTIAEKDNNSFVEQEVLIKWDF